MAQQSYKKFVATAATATLVASALVPVASANVSTSAFTDVPASYKDAVDFVVSNNISSGLTATQYGISQQIKRGDAAVIIAAAAGLNDTNAAASGFSDVPTRGALAVNSLKAAGVVKGKSTTKFGFEDNITRGEAALMLQKAFDLQSGNTKNEFSDVSDRYDAAVDALVANGVTKGINEKQFGTQNNIKRGDFAKFIYALKDKVILGVAVESVTVVDETTTTVKLKEADKDLKAEDFNVLVNGEKVTPSKVVSDAKGEVYTLTHDSLAGKKGNVSVNGVLGSFDFVPGETKLVSVKTVASDSVEVTLLGDTKDLTAKDFKIKGDGLSVVDVAISGKTATIKFNKDMTDGAEYTLQLIDEEENVLSEATFNYKLGAVASIALTKSNFEEGERVTNFLKVLDENGVEVSSADYNVLEVQSSNTDVVDNNKYGTVKAEGTSNVRFKIEYKDGSVAWSDFLTVKVAEAVTADLAGYNLNTDGTADQFDNTVDYRIKAATAKTTLYETDDAQYLEVYADDSKGNPEIHALDLSAGSEYEVKSLDTNVATVSQDTNGTKLNYVAPGKARVLITGKDNYKKTVTVNVSKAPVYKDIVLGSTELKLSDEVLTNLSSVADVEEGVTEDTVSLKWKDQNGDNHVYDLSTATVNSDNDQIVLENAIVTGDKLVISSANTKGAFTIDTEGENLKVVAAEDKEVSGASIRVSYYADKTANKPTTQKVISTSVANIDASKSAADYQTLVDNSAIDPNSSTANTATVTAYAVDKNGNKVGNVTDEITLTASETVTNSEKKWFVFDENQVTFATDAKYYMTEKGALKVNYTVEGASNPHGFVTLNYENSFAAPNKAVVNTKPAVVDVTDVTKYTGGVITAESLLFGKILANSPELVIDTDSTINTVNNNASIAVKKGKTGYVNNPILSFVDTKGDAIKSGASLYGLNVTSSKPGNGYVVDTNTGNYLAGTKFDVEYSISNAKNLEVSDPTNAIDNQLSIEAGKDQASFTIVITKVTAIGDPRINNAGVADKKNLIDSPKSIDVILK